MIARLKGRLEDVGEDWLVIDVGGVGYLVYASRRTLSDLPGIGEAVVLEIETHVREDHIHLFGFGHRLERDWFRLLQSVQGVGARVALALLTVLTPDELATAIMASDKTALSRADGVGGKLAQRVVNELKDKVGQFPAAGPAGPIQQDRSGTASAAPTGANADSEAVSALVNLGFGRSEAFTAIAKVRGELGDGADIGALIRSGLKELSP